MARTREASIVAKLCSTRLVSEVFIHLKFVSWAEKSQIFPKMFIPQRNLSTALDWHKHAPVVAAPIENSAFPVTSRSLIGCTSHCLQPVKCGLKGTLRVPRNATNQNARRHGESIVFYGSSHNGSILVSIKCSKHIPLRNKNFGQTLRFFYPLHEF